MKNKIRQAIAKIESMSSETNMRSRLFKEIAEQGISNIRLSQFRGNHRQPRVDEMDKIYRVLKKYDTELELTDLYESEPNPIQS